MQITASSTGESGRLRRGEKRPSLTDWILGARRRGNRRRRRAARAVIAVAAVVAAGAVWHAYQNRGATILAAAPDVFASFDRDKAVPPGLSPPVPAAKPEPQALQPAAYAVPAAQEPAIPEPADLAAISPALGDATAVPKPMQVTALDTPVEISEMQRLLAKLDFRPGPPDGVLGHRTVEAIRIYQKFAGLDIDGRATSSLLDDLRAVAAKMPEPVL